MLRQSDELLEDVAVVRIDAYAPYHELLISQQRPWFLLDRRNVCKRLPRCLSLLASMLVVQMITRQYGADEINL